MSDPHHAIFALPPGCDFARQFALGLLARYGKDSPEDFARIRVYVNTRRSARAISEVLAAEGAILLPQIIALADLGNDPFAPLDLPPATPPLRQQLIIAQLVGRFLEMQPNLAPRAAMFDLAKSLGALLDELQGAGLPVDVLDSIDVEKHSAHWERVLSFLKIINDYWQNHRPDAAPDPEGRARAVAEAYAEHWQAHPPAHPVIVAGSTGSRDATALFMQAVAKLPNGAVVLPGFDFDMPAAVWEQLGPDHPQYGFAKLGGLIGFGPDIARWTDAAAPQPARNKLVSLALRPAPVTDQWLAEGPAMLPDLPQALAELTVVEAPSKRAEAQAIAVQLRLALDQGKTAALVTPDRVLARYVTAALQVWGIDPDDSAGRPLPLTPPAVFLRRIAGLGDGPLLPVALLALLKHPLCGGIEDDRKAHLRWARQLEIQQLRGGPPFVEWAALEIWAQKSEIPEIVLWVANLRDALDPWMRADGERALQDWLDLHRGAAEALARGCGQTPFGQLWEQEAGQASLAIFNKLAAHADLGGMLSRSDYRALFSSVLTGEVREAAFRPDPRVAIRGTLEARVQSADLVILGGLNDGVWPRIPDPDPWLNRDMRRQIGLALPERRIGLSGHDFQQAIGAKEVVLTRALRDGDAPTVASRLMIRLLNLTEGLAGKDAPAVVAMRDRGRQLLDWAARLEAPAEFEQPAARPAPSPPISARPDRLSVTRVETLIRNPYEIYASYVLKLRKLDPLGRDPDALERGKVIHLVLEEFVKETLDHLPADAVERLKDVAARVIESNVPWPTAQTLWKAKFSQMAEWLVEQDRAMRAEGFPFADGLEISGERSAEIAGRNFTLRAKADRIDIGGSGARIYDYKSGSAPSAKEVAAFSRQLPLEGCIAAAGGFKGVPATDAEALVHVALGSGGKVSGLNEAELDSQTVWADFVSLVAAYSSTEVGYAARIRPQFIRYKSDYDHLSRLGEWEDGDTYTVQEVGPL